MPTVRVTFDEETFRLMKRNAPAALQDPEVIRHYVSLGMLFTDVRMEGILDNTSGSVDLTDDREMPEGSFRDAAEPELDDTQDESGESDGEADEDVDE